MKSSHSLALVAAAAFFVPSGALVAQDSEAPSLVLMVTVDQLRSDLVSRYDEVFTGGLRRFLDDGYNYTGASHAHAVTHTAAGHATLSTGVFPSRSGIVANSWQHRENGEWRSMYAVEDRDHPILGFETVPQLPGRSPVNMKRTGIADWILEADSDARTVSVSSKDRAAITMAGKTDENVFWLLSPLSRFITSTFYEDRYPGWLNRFNDNVMPAIAADTAWTSEVPERFRGLARDDEGAPFEGDGTHTTFPHLSSQESSGGPQQHNAWAFGQSRADRAVAELAKAAVDEMELGQRGHTDFLSISLSATDYVGHGYGPLSQEQLSNLIHLDRVLGDLLDYLDDEVGEDNWVAGFSADHGVVTMPEAAQAMGNDEAERILLTEMNGKIGDVAAKAMGGRGTPEEMAERTARALEDEGLVARAYTHDELTYGEPADSFAVLFRNSHYPGRAHGQLSQYGVEFRYGDGDLVSFPTGTTHGSPYWYDRQVPFILLGAGIDSGSSDRAVYTVDMAPTLAALAGIRTPDDLDGRVVTPGR